MMVGLARVPLFPPQTDGSRPVTHRSPAGDRVSHQPGCAHPPSSQGRPPATPVCGGGGSFPLAQASRPCLIGPRGQGPVMLCPWTPSDAGVSSSLSCSSVLPPLPALLLRQPTRSTAHPLTCSPGCRASAEPACAAVRPCQRAVRTCRRCGCSDCDQLGELGQLT